MDEKISHLGVQVHVALNIYLTILRNEPTKFGTQEEQLWLHFRHQI